MPLDGLPYVGKLSPFSNRLFVATGFNKWGLTNGTAAGMMVADAIAGRDNPWAEVFSPNRLSLRASAQPFASEAAWRIKRYTKDRGLPALQRLTSRFAPKASYSTVGRDLNPGQGRIDELGGEKVAVSKDANGVVCVVSPVCTHLGCTVEYNDDEKTWDCPCHGSRFLNDGTVLQGPAKTPLASVMRGGKPTPAAGNGEATGQAR
jgi:Rieske Fe-S protein